MRLLILFVAVSIGSSVQATKKHGLKTCDDLECKAGRECVMVEDQPECLCVISCPDHFKPVCGSDGKSYDNHCSLHQHACTSGDHIRIEHKGHCKKKKKATFDSKTWKKDKHDSLLSKKDLQEEIQNDLVQSLRKDERKAKNRPAVCYGPQRNAIRFLLVDHWKETLKTQPWFTEGMMYRESLWGWFFTCDSNKDNFLTPEELLKCSKDVSFFARPEQDNELTKELCIDAMVDDGDKNQDWRLDFEEFTRIMNPKYQPKEKKCSLEGKKYLDGEEIHLICNHCVCAVGNWVCASQDCDEEKTTPTKKLSFHSVDEFDNAIDEHVLDPFHASPDTWMEKNLKDKKRGKELSGSVPNIEDPVFHPRKTSTKDSSLKNSKKFLESFLDFDTIDIEPTPKKLKDEEQAELGLDDYYDDLYEQTKSKKKQRLEKALKEVKLLKKKTNNLKKMLKSPSKKKNHSVKKNKKQEKEMRDIIKNYRAVNFRNEHHKKNHPKQSFHDEFSSKKHNKYSLDKYEGDLFEKNSWTDLITTNENELF